MSTFKSSCVLYDKVDALCVMLMILESIKLSIKTGTQYFHSAALLIINKNFQFTLILPFICMLFSSPTPPKKIYNSRNSLF